MTTIYRGVIFEAYPDFGSQPEVSFVVSANPGMDLQQTPTEPISIKGPTDVTTVLEQVVNRSGSRSRVTAPRSNYRTRTYRAQPGRR
jgi:hypothetical protein